MTKPFVYITRRIPQSGLNLIARECEMEIWDAELPPPRKVLLEKIKNAEGLLCLLTDLVNEELLNEAPKLRVVSNYAVGFDNIDVKEITRRKIPAGNTPEVLTDTTADMAFALILSAARRLGEAERFVRSGKWKTWGPTLLLGGDVHHAALGIIGMGRIGQAVARRAKGFDMRVVYCDPKRCPEIERETGAVAVDFRTLVGVSDFISIHTRLNDSTRNLFAEREFKLMKPNAVLVNTARGQIVNSHDLYEALKNGEIAAAALDVTDPEPIPPDHPLLSLDNCTIVPHIGSASIQTRDKMAVMAAENLLAGLQGKQLPNCINPQVYD
jgi:glyoxylate reductase